MADLSKLFKLLDDPEVRVVVFGLAHVGAVRPSVEAGAPRLRAVLMHLADTTDPDQFRSWLADDVPNIPMTVDQVRVAVGDDAINDLARYASCHPSDLAWQLAAVLPDLVDALSPGGNVIEPGELGQELQVVIAEGDESAGAFGPHLH